MAGDYNVFARSVSGLETTVVLHKISEKFNVCFDMGIACRENQSCDRVFIRYILKLFSVVLAVPRFTGKTRIAGKTTEIPERPKNNIIE